MENIQIDTSWLIPNSVWKNVKDELPEIGVSVIRSDYAVEGHPEYLNQCVDHITPDCNTGELKWFLDKRKPYNELWAPLPIPPFRPK